MKVGCTARARRVLHTGGGAGEADRRQHRNGQCREHDGPGARPARPSADLRQPRSGAGVGAWARRAQRSGPNASAAGQREAAERADIVVLAVPGSALEEVTRSLGDLSGKIVVDITSAPKRQAADGYLELVSDTSNSERLQSRHTNARLVRINIPTAFLFLDPLALGTPPTVPIAADDREAKEVVARIIFDLGLDPWDAGPLRFARWLDAMGLLFWVPLLQERNEGIELKLLRSSAMPCFVNVTERLERPRDFDDLAPIPQREPPIPCDAWKFTGRER